MAKQKRKPGRPPLPVAKRVSGWPKVRIDPALYAECERAAKRGGMSVVRFINLCLKNSMGGV